MSVRRVSILLCALVTALAVAACGSSTPTGAGSSPPGQLSGHEVGNVENDGSYIQAGPITYQLQISRQLNPFSIQDEPYLRGLPAGFAQPTASQLWYGVFLWAKNQHHRAYETSGNFEIVDTQGNVYHPIALDPNVNLFAWQPTLLQYGDTYPGPNTVASLGESQGGLLLFKLNDSVYSNRPLTLFVLNHQGQRLGSISLDL